MNIKQRHYLIFGIILILYLIPPVLVISKNMKGSFSVNVADSNSNPNTTQTVKINYIIKNLNRKSVSMLFWSNSKITVDIVRILSDTKSTTFISKSILNTNITIDQKGINLISPMTTSGGIADQMVIYFYSPRSQSLLYFTENTISQYYPTSSAYYHLAINRRSINIPIDEYSIAFLIALGLASFETYIIYSEAKSTKKSLSIPINKNAEYPVIGDTLLRDDNTEIKQIKHKTNPLINLAYGILALMIIIPFVTNVSNGFLLIIFFILAFLTVFLFNLIVNEIGMFLVNENCINILHYNLIFTLFSILSIYYSNQFIQFFLIKSIFNLFGYLLILGLVNLFLMMPKVNLRFDNYVFVIYSILKLFAFMLLIGFIYGYLL